MPATPYNVSFSNYTTTSVRVNYSVGVDNDQVNVRLYSSGSFLYWTRPSFNNYYTITGLSPDTTYYVMLQSVDADGYGSNWSTSYYFSTDANTPTCPTPTYATRSGSYWDYDPCFYIGHNNADLVSEGYTVTPLYWFDFSTWERTDGQIWLKNLEAASCTIYYRVRVSRSGYTTSYGPTSSYGWSKSTCAAVSNHTPVMEGSSAYFYISHSAYHQPHIRWTKYSGGTYLSEGTVDGDDAWVPLNYGETAFFYGWQTHIGWYDGPVSSTVSITREQPTCTDPFNISYGISSDHTAANISFEVAAGESGNVRWWRYNANGDLEASYDINYVTSASIQLVPNGMVRYKIWASRSDYIDSNFLPASGYYEIVRPNDRPSNSSYFNFVAGQAMDVTPTVKQGNDSYACDAYVMSAGTWNGFTSKVNAFRQYYDNKYASNIGQVSFTQVSSGTVFSASIYNEVATAINTMGVSYIAMYASTDEITAAAIMRLQDRLNSVA